MTSSQPGAPDSPTSTKGIYRKLPPGIWVFNVVSGGALLLASIIAGSLWREFGASVMFFGGASFAVFAALGLFNYRPK